MRTPLLILFFTGLSWLCPAQNHQDILNLKPDSAVSGIKMLKIAGDKNSTSFVIWIKESVKAHRHKEHTENIYILEGEGEMKINGQILKIKPGDFVNIPENVVHSVKVSSPFPMKVLSVQSPEFNGEDRIWVDE